MDNPTEMLIQSRTGKRHYAAVFIALVAACGLLWLGYRPWKERQQALASTAKEDSDRALPVTAALAKRSPGSLDLSLPGSVAAITESSIYARAEGYVKARLVDIGDRVKAGQLLVEIDTPELDDQLRQAVARVAQANAVIGQSKAAVTQTLSNLRLAEINIGRSRELVRQGIAARQDLDDKQAAYDARQADVQAAKAALNSAEESARAAQSEVARLTNLTAFKKVTAPFAGVITSRTTDVGNLINSSALASGRELYRLADISTVRLMINVPEPSAPAIRPGQAARVILQEFNGQAFQGKVTRTANALDAGTRTLPTEVQVPNPSGKLLPGMYANVVITASGGGPAVTIPGDTVTVRSDGAYVAVIQPGSVIHFQKVALGRDYGSEVEVTQGLQGTETLVVNPSDSVREGVKVNPKMQQSKK
jgi:RND family efflux transporter MFP subunit